MHVCEAVQETPDKELLLNLRNTIEPYAQECSFVASCLRIRLCSQVSSSSGAAEGDRCELSLSFPPGFYAYLMCSIVSALYDFSTINVQSALDRNPFRLSAGCLVVRLQFCS